VIESMKNSVGYLISLMTKERIIYQMNKGANLNTDQNAKLKLMLLRKILIKLYLRQALYLSQLRRHSEAAELSKLAVAESITVCLETARNSLEMTLRLEKLKKDRLLQQHQSSTSQNSPTINLNWIEDCGERRMHRELFRQKQVMNEHFPERETGSPQERQREEVLSEEQKLMVEHLANYLPIVKKLVEHIELLGHSAK
jgi:hypothetical protein